MAINIKFDFAGNPEPPTIILANRNGNKLGQLKVDTNSVDLSDKFNDISEFTFTLNKYVDGVLTNLWDKVVDFKLVYCKEWNMWFDIKVELDETTKTIKTVFCTQLGQSELSQIKLYDVEINTEQDIEREDYKISILYDENDPKASILDRMLEKAPHYSIAHVDPTIRKIQRSFSFDDTSICDGFNEVGEEIGCLFVYNSNSDENGKIRRDISVYDLQQNCNDCGYRGEFTDKCPKCGSTNIKYGYGEDTLIFVTSDELASEGIKLVTDVDSVKNCFKLEAGDDLMTATIRNCNPNGTDYIWYFSDDIKEDMSGELVEKLESYNKLYRQYYNEYSSNVDVSLLNSYNSLINKYSTYNEDLQQIATPITGYSSLMNAYYNVIDLSLYLKSGLMPSVEISGTNAEEQVILLTPSSLSPVAVADVAVASLATVNSAVLAMAKTIVRPTYKVQIGTSELINQGNKKVWNGNFVVTNYSDEEDTAIGSVISVDVNDDLEAFVNQKLDKILNKENTDDLSISGLFEKEYNDFCKELKKYALNPLVSFRDACQSCIDILIEQGVANNDTWADTDEGSESNLYENLYMPYYNKLMAIEAEIKIREDEINIVSGVYDVDGNLTSEGLQQNIEECKSQIQNALDFESYLGNDLWLEFCTYRREDTYSNDNYISDGLNNAELFKRALEFFEVAENEIYKSSELQHSISTTLNNLLAIPKFKPLVKSFKLGNWIRVRVDDRIYKLRLLEYGINYGDFKNISVEFSDVTKIKNGITDVESILSQASSMASSYSAIQKQAKQGDEAQGTIDEWLTSGLNTALVRIQNNNSEDITFTKNGLLGRSYNELTDTYSPEQFKLTHNIFAYTTDNWETVSSALGKHGYKYWNGQNFVDAVDYGLSTKFVTAGYVTGSQIIGGEVVSSNYKPKQSGTYFNLIDGDFDIAGGSIVYDASDNALTLKKVTIEWDSSNTPEITDISGLSDYIDQLEQLENQLDGRAETWYQSTDPSVAWTTTEAKSLHKGDLWHYTGETAIVGGVERIKNSEWVWQEVNGSYQWVAIEISDIVFDAIDGKAQIFTSTPTPPYYVGDLWVQGSSGDILHCVNPKSEGQSYSASDWVKSSKYTDDTVAKEALEKAKQGIADAADGIDLAKAAQEAADEANKKAQDAEDNAKQYADNQDKSLSDTLTEAYKTYADTKVSTLDTAVGNYLGLGGSTLVGSNYVISPYIAGGYLNITNVNNNSRVIIDPNNLTNNNYIFQVHNGNKVTVGVDSSGNATFNGAITATSLTLGNDVRISTDNISGLDKYARTEDIPESVTELIGGDNIIYADDVSVSSTTESDGTVKQTITVGDKQYTSIVDGDFIFTDIGLGTNTEDGSKTYTCISTDGLLTAKNALIYGTIFATKGEIGGCSISDGVLKIKNANISEKITASQIDATNLKVDAANITGELKIGQLPDTVAETSDIPTDISELNNNVGYQTETGVTTIIDGRITTDYVEALGITVDAAKITGKLEASQIDATNLEVDAANITGTFSVSDTSGNALFSAGNNTVSLAGWKVNNSSLTNGTLGDEYFIGLYSKYPSTTNLTIGNVSSNRWRIIAGNNKFGVTSDGILSATDVDLTGKITANYGNIGGWTIGSQLTATTVKTAVGIKHTQSVILSTDGVTVESTWDDDENSTLTPTIPDYITLGKKYTKYVTWAELLKVWE